MSMFPCCGSIKDQFLFILIFSFCEETYLLSRSQRSSESLLSQALVWDQTDGEFDWSAASTVEGQEGFYCKNAERPLQNFFFCGLFFFCFRRPSSGLAASRLTGALMLLLCCSVNLHINSQSLSTHRVSNSLGAGRFTPPSRKMLRLVDQ